MVVLNATHEVLFLSPRRIAALGRVVRYAAELTSLGSVGVLRLWCGSGTGVAVHFVWILDPNLSPSTWCTHPSGCMGEWKAMSIPAAADDGGRRISGAVKPILQAEALGKHLNSIEGLEAIGTLPQCFARGASERRDHHRVLLSCTAGTGTTGVRLSAHGCPRFFRRAMPHSFNLRLPVSVIQSACPGRGEAQFDSPPLARPFPTVLLMSAAITCPWPDSP